LRRIVFVAIILSFLVISAPSITTSFGVWSQALAGRSYLAESNISRVDALDVENGTNYKSGLGIYTASGKTETLPLLSDKCTVNVFSFGNSSTIFVNDLRGGDKIDILLRNYTLLSQEGYLQSNDRVRVLALTGEPLKPDTYIMCTLNKAETMTLSETIHSLNGTITSRYTSLPYIAVEMPYEKVFAFSQLNMISHVFLDTKYTVHLSESVPIIKPAQKWQQIENYFGFQINGTDIKIAILDTGIDSTHPDLQGKVVLAQCFTDEGKTTDGFGHGTHCASIAAGTGAASNYVYVGVAPGALLLNGKVLTDAGWGYESWIIQGIEWAVEQGADVLSMSFGNTVNGDGTDPISMAVDWATDQGAVCAVAAGNSGYFGMNSVGSPAVARKAITVGATTKTDYMADFSSQGLTSDQRLKPDVCAPGVDIVAARASGTSMGTPINDYYTMASGTSMATPHVAGAAALILQAHPDWTPIMVKSALMGNAKVLTGEHLWKQGAGRIDVCEAVNSTLLIVEPSVSFGVLEYGLSQSTTFTVINTVAFSQAVNLSTYTTCGGVETDYVHLNATLLSIPAYSSAHVMMTVGPLDEEALDGWYEGWLNIVDGNRSRKAPYLFVAESLIKVTLYDVDDLTPISATLVLCNYPDMTLVDWGQLNAGSQVTPVASFFEKSGNYSICANAGWIESAYGVDYSRMFMIEKVFSVPKFSVVNVRLSLAEAYIKEIPTVDQQGKNLVVHAYTHYFCGHLYYPLGKPMFWWSTQYMWAGFNLTIPRLTLYCSEYSPPEELCEDIGYYASDNMMTEIYLFNWKFTGMPNLPAVITQDHSKLARYHVYYDMPETYPENGLNVNNAFWFTWENIGLMQTWGWDLERVHAGITAIYYLTPTIAWYWGDYMATYGGWSEKLFGPLQEWTIRGQLTPPMEREAGSMTLGRFDFGPYAPGIILGTHRVGGLCYISLVGSVWVGLNWPHIFPFEYYPVLTRPYYILYVDGALLTSGELVRYDNLGIFWDDLSFSWAVSGERAMLQIFMPSLATISRQTVYCINFSLTQDLDIPPLFYKMQMPLNYEPNENITINLKTPNTALFSISNISLSYSFDGSPWHPAQASPTQSFIVPCQAADELAVQIKAIDNNGNSFEYYSNPVALCKKVNLSKSMAGSSIVMKATTLNGNPIPNIALKIDTSNGSFYALLDNMGEAELPISLGRFKAWFPTVGLYEGTLAPKPDIAVVDIRLSRSEVYVGRRVSVYVTVENCGEFNETFSVKTYCDNSVIGTLAVDSLGAGMNCTLTFSFNVNGFILYVNHTIRAEASILPYEINTANNVLVKGSIRARAVGDVNNDKKVDILDIVLIASIYGYKQGDPGWNESADLAPEWGKIDILDLVTCTIHYGEKY
jgi:subtilisin family serine protease